MLILGYYFGLYRVCVWNTDSWTGSVRRQCRRTGLRCLCEAAQSTGGKSQSSSWWQYACVKYRSSSSSSSSEPAQFPCPPLQLSRPPARPLTGAGSTRKWPSRCVTPARRQGRDHLADWWLETLTSATVSDNCQLTATFTSSNTRCSFLTAPTATLQVHIWVVFRTRCANTVYQLINSTNFKKVLGLG